MTVGPTDVNLDWRSRNGSLDRSYQCSDRSIHEDHDDVDHNPPPDGAGAARGARPRTATSPLPALPGPALRVRMHSPTVASRPVDVPLGPACAASDLPRVVLRAIRPWPRIGFGCAARGHPIAAGRGLSRFSRVSRCRCAGVHSFRQPGVDSVNGRRVPRAEGRRCGRVVVRTRSRRSRRGHRGVRRRPPRRAAPRAPRRLGDHAIRSSEQFSYEAKLIGMHGSLTPGECSCRCCSPAPLPGGGGHGLGARLSTYRSYVASSWRSVRSP
jgi:hypothetical protein